MRDFFLMNWADEAKNGIAKIVASNYANEAHRWPLLRSFNWEGYIWNSKYIILILRDKLSGVSAGPSKPKPLDNSSALSVAPNITNLEMWHSYIQSKFNIRSQDMAIIIPVTSDENLNINDDWAEWSEADKQLWQKQIDLNIAKHFYYLKGFDLIDEFFIPPGYQFLADECEKFFKDHPHYDHNILIMTRFVASNSLLEELNQELRNILIEHSMNPVKTDDKMYLRDRNLWNNVCVYMICCKFGIAILEDRVVNEFNPNVALEYGFMRALNKPALLLTDVGFRNLRADIIGTLRESFDIIKIRETIKAPIEKWLKEVGIIGNS